jgi:hypothetical protein
MSTAQPFWGTWRIVEMEAWDRDACDLLGPAHFTFGRDGLGTFRFIAVEGDMDYRFGARDGKPLVEFSWSGHDENDPASGRGWAVVDSDVLTGRIFIHRGDDSAFTAKRGDVALKPRRSRRSR